MKSKVRQMQAPLVHPVYRLRDAADHLPLCGIQPKQTDIDFEEDFRIDAADAKLLAFDLLRKTAL